LRSGVHRQYPYCPLPLFAVILHGSKGINDPGVTLVLTNWKRPENVRLIIDQLLGQTLKPTLFLWNNLPPFLHPGVDWQVDSSVNKMCLPRWYMASFAQTEFVGVMDDDVIFTDTKVLEDAAIFLLSMPEETAIGFTGMHFDPRKDYREGLHIVASKDADQPADVIKGRFMLLRTAQLARFHLHPSPQREHLIGEDILMSGMLSQGKTGVHRVPALFAGRWQELPAPHGLFHLSDHWFHRESARRAVFLRE